MAWRQLGRRQLLPVRACGRRQHSTPSRPPPPLTHDGRIGLTIGPMFSGKTRALLRAVALQRELGRACLLVKHTRDTRHRPDVVRAHNGEAMDAVACTRLADVADLVRQHDVVGIDEGQFFEDLVPFCEGMANEGKVVEVAALDATFQREPFGQVLNLIPKAEAVTKLRAVCRLCKKEAAFSRRLSDETAIEVVGGADKYAPVCRWCYFQGAATHLAPCTQPRQ